MRRRGLLKAASAAIAIAAGGIAAVWSVPAAAETELTVYTAVEAEDLKRYAAEFNKDHPDIKIKWVRDSTGIVTAKLLAEKNNPQADVVWGLAATSLLLLKSEGMLEPYAPKGVDKLDPKFVDQSDPPTWVGMDAWVAAVCYNTVEAAKHNLTPPKSWKDLTKEMYKGHVIMPNPNSSGTGFLDVSSWLQMFGEEERLEVHGRSCTKISRATPIPAPKPCKLAAAGEIPIGISFAFRGAKSKAAGRTAGNYCSLRGRRLGHGGNCHRGRHRKSERGADTGRLVDHVTKEANEMYNTGYAVVAIPGRRQAG